MECINICCTNIVPIISVKRELGELKDFYSLQKFRVTSERRWNAKGILITESEATINVTVPNEKEDKMASNWRSSKIPLS